MQRKAAAAKAAEKAAEEKAARAAKAGTPHRDRTPNSYSKLSRD